MLLGNVNQHRESIVMGGILSGVKMAFGVLDKIITPFTIIWMGSKVWRIYHSFSSGSWALQLHYLIVSHLISLQ
jgi:hypothetical protein